MTTLAFGLTGFIAESNRIEGIFENPSSIEVEVYKTFLFKPILPLQDICDLVTFVAKAPLRDKVGLNVMVGSYFPPPSGPEIKSALIDIIKEVNEGLNPYYIHQRYETLHPFMDGNGRSGRAIWLWQMIRQVKDPYVFQRGFLHSWYYQSLQYSR